MIELAKVRPTATVFIKPNFSLAETAEKLGAVLGGVKFTAREYHEVPAFDGRALGFHFTLFDIPDSVFEIMEGEEAPTEYLFYLFPSDVKVADEYEHIDLSNFVANAIEANSDLQCRVSQEEGL